MKHCTIAGCAKNTRVVLGLCRMHYARFKKTGDPNSTKLIRGDDGARLSLYYDDHGKEECWDWKGAVLKCGYGVFRLNNKQKKAHRVVYERYKGAIPKNLVLDHLCRNKKCVNPNHLEPVTVRENVLRGIGPAAINSKKEYCKMGHMFDKFNTYIIPHRNSRICKTCFRRYQAEYRERLKTLNTTA